MSWLLIEPLLHGSKHSIRMRPSLKWILDYSSDPLYLTSANSVSFLLIKEPSVSSANAVTFGRNKDPQISMLSAVSFVAKTVPNISSVSAVTFVRSVV